MIRRSFLILALSLTLAGSTWAGPLERVPQDGTLQQALQRVSNGGVIEIDNGTYPSPASGFRIRNMSVTVRAVPGATAIIDGLGTNQIFRVEDQGPDSGRYVSFEGLTFQNGFTTETRRAGGVTVDSANVTFVSCVFDSNVAGGPAGSQARGGAVHVLSGSYARFVNSRFTDNLSGQWGAGIFAIEESKVHVNWSVFTGNRTDLPGQGPVPAGGAIYIQDSELHVNASHFEDNASGWTGGALYAIGTFGTPGATMVVDNSTFIGNQAFPDDCCTVPGPSTGGAIHVEDQVSLTVRDSRFEENFTHWGGAISTFRAAVEVRDSTFRGNRGSPPDGVPAAGGTINLTSSDGLLASLVMSDSLVQGRFGGTTTGAQQGGCLFASGALGNPTDANRTVVDLDNVVFADCDVETGPESTGFGGAIFLNVADLTLDDSIIFDSDALGDGALGGAIMTFGNTRVRATGSAFARNVAEARGGGIRMSGGHVEIDDCFFLENDVTPDIAPGQPGELIQQSPGAALALGPSGALDITGFVADSVFTDNIGIPIVDVTGNTGTTFNDVVYNNNRIRSTSFGNSVYKNAEGGFFGGFTVDQLNDLSFRGMSKSDVDNDFLSSTPTEGRLVAAPSRVIATGTPVDPDTTSSFLGYAWSGSLAAIDPGPDPNDNVGLTEVDDAANYRLRVGGETVASDRLEEKDCNSEVTLCLNRERFLVEVDWRDFRSRIGEATVVFGAEDSGLYWFFSEDNWELLIKVLNGCAITDHFWVFAAATTNVEYVMRVTDKVTGISKSYFNPLGNAAAAITDTEALAVCDAESGFSAWETPEERPAVSFAPSDPPAGPEIDDKQGTCSPSATEMCLNRDRFRAEVAWRTANGNTGSAQVASLPVASDDSGIFFFFNESNLEMLLKVLNGCGITNHFWVFSAATTDVEYTLTVTDTQTGAVKTYFNRLGNAAAAVTDTEAFATCP